jgi:predicted PurR-regulated permease PerM
MLKSQDPITKAILKVFLIAGGIFLFWYLGDLILIVLLSLVFASALEPFVATLSHYKIPRVISVLFVYLSFLGVLAASLWLVVPRITTEFDKLAQTLPLTLYSLQNDYGTLSRLFNSLELSDIFTRILSSSSGAGHSVFTSTINIVKSLFGFLTVLVFSFYMLIDPKGLHAVINLFTPVNRRQFVFKVFQKIQTKMGYWLLGQILLGLSVFLMSYLLLTLFGINYAFFLALLVGLFEVIPFLGPILAAIPAVIIAFIQNPPLVIVVAIIYLSVQKIEGWVLVPKIMHKTVGIPPLAVILGILIGLKIGGPVGGLLAIPMVGAVSVVLEELREESVL